MPARMIQAEEFSIHDGLSSFEGAPLAKDLILHNLFQKDWGIRNASLLTQSVIQQQLVSGPGNI